MAEINLSNKTKKATKGKKLSTRIDLTPMVDLGFLLITFFIFTTSLSEAKAMKLVLPSNGTGSLVPANKTLNLTLVNNNTIKWYEGDNTADMHETNYSAKGLRAVIQRKKLMVRNSFGDSAETVVLIKPTKDASYGNIVDALDEMEINKISTYVLMEAKDEELLKVLK